MHVDTRTVTSVALAVACVVAVAAAADGFASLSTDPSDVVDPEFDRLPAGEGELEALRREVVSAERGSDSVRAEPRESVEASSSSQAERERSTQSQQQQRQQQQRQHQQQEQSEGQSSESGSQPPPADEPPWRLLAAALVALAVAGALAYRYRDRLRGGDEPPQAAFGDARPGSEVERAWLTLVRRVDADRPETRTPREWATAAVDGGLDADAVVTLTRAFESVRYGDRDETEERRRRVRRAVDRLDSLPREADGGQPSEDRGDER